MEFDGNLCVGTRTIYVGGPVTQDTASEIIRYLHLLNQDKKKRPIHLIINCEGGDVDASMAIYDALKLSPCPLVGTVIGICYSAATTILQACDKRLLSPNAILMIHDGTISIRQNHMLEVAVEAGQIRKDCLTYYKIMSERSGLSVSKIKKLCRFSTYFTANQAVNSGFADEILLSEKVKNGPLRKARKTSSRRARRN